MLAVESPCLVAALDYIGQGWYVVPIRSGGKAPWLDAWQREASIEESVVGRWFTLRPDSGVGVMLGPRSNLIDIECDDQAAELKFRELFDGVEIVTATYAGMRGKHRLFKWRQDLPEPSKALFKIGALEFRTGNGSKGAQSVFPPSTHPSGGKYRWLVTPDEGGVADLPDHVVARLWNWNGDGPEATGNGKPRKTKEEWDAIAAGCGEGGRNLNAAALIGGLLRGLGSLDDPALLEVTYQAAASINERNKPPLDEKELRETFGSILRREKQRRASETADAVLTRTPEERIAEATKAGIKTPDNMKLVIVESDPPLYELYASQFHKARDGCLRLSASQLCSYGALKVQALEQAEYPLPAEFKKAWERKGGLYEQVIHAAEKRPAAAVERRLATIAEYLLGKLEAATPRGDGKDEPDPRKPTRMSNGSIWFRWSETWKDGIFDGAVQREDPHRLANCIGLSEADFVLWPRHGDKRKRFCRFNPARLADIRRLAEMADDEPLSASKNEELV